jgi:Putative Ig domain
MVAAIDAAVLAAKTLTAGQAGVLLAVMIGGSLFAGIIIIGARSTKSAQRDASPSIVRSWLAVTLVLGLLSACAAAFEIDDVQLRNTLLGGLVASTGAATAFYFSSKGADSARSDILSATKTLALHGEAPDKFTAVKPPDAQVDAEYPGYTFVARGTPPMAYKVGSGNAPDGLELDPDGFLHGRPTTPGPATFTVLATNALGSLPSEPVTIKVEAKKT